MLPNPREVVDHGDRSSNEGGHASLETRGLDCFLHIDKKTLRLLHAGDAAICMEIEISIQEALPHARKPEHPCRRCRRPHENQTIHAERVTTR